MKLKQFLNTGSILRFKFKKLNLKLYKEEILLCRMNQKQLKSVFQAKNIKVFIRIRPFNTKQSQSDNCIDSYTQNSISIKQRQSKQKHNFTFDKIFNQRTNQRQIYQQMGQKLIQSSFQGINGTIFCYGQTSSGKTHTCIGPNLNDVDQCGILPRLIKQTLQKIKQLPKNIQAKMKISMVQIYNQKIRDLLDSSKNDLKIRSNQSAGIYLDGVTEKYILTKQQAFQYLQFGLQHRSYSFTNMNARSSRSHMMFIINLYSHDVYSGQAKTAKISLIDLAGSQKISKSGAQGKKLQQAKKINTSLTALGKVISILSEGKSSHIPYRDSKITRLLQESLGGNSLTNLIINISPSSFNDSQTLTSIRFGSRAKNIKNAPKINKSYTVSQLLKLLEKAEKKIKDQNNLINQLSKKKSRNGGYGSLAIPKMITMHLIKDSQDDSQVFIQEDDIFFNQQKIKNNSGPYNLIQIIQDQKQMKFIKTAQTQQWTQNEKGDPKDLGKKGILQMTNCQKNQDNFVELQKYRVEDQKTQVNRRQDCCLKIFNNISLKIDPSIREIETQKQNINCLDNLGVIRKNITLMKQKLQKNQNKKKEILIQQKNNVIGKLFQ